MGLVPVSTPYGIIISDPDSTRDELVAEVRALRDIIIKMDTWCRILDADLTELQDKVRRSL